MIRSLLLLSALLLAVVPVVAQDHFQPVDATGLPYAFAVESAQANGAGLVAGDEIAVFDGDLCVGAVVVTGDWPLALTAWEGDDDLNLDGFTAGNPILFKVWQQAGNTETRGLADYLAGNGRFDTGFGAQVDVVATTGNVQFNIWCPNPDLPVEGGALSIGVQIWSGLGVTNNSAAFWTAVTTPGGQTYDALTVVPFTHTPFMSVVNNALTQVIPNAAPAGTYTFTGKLGFYPNPLLTDSFTFTKAGAQTDSAAGRDAWVKGATGGLTE